MLFRSNPIEGGTTPSYGMIRHTREKIGIKLYPIIRPRCGNYFYSDEEFEVMRQDILVCRELKCDGISVGISRQDGRVDTERFKRIVEWAYPMGVTSNRVIDAAPDPYEALDALIEAGCERVLTSGQRSSAPEGLEVLKKLVKQGDGRISIMPGAGVRSSNIEMLLASGAKEYHTSARVIVPNTVTHQNPDILDTGHPVICDGAELKKIMEVLQKAQ